MSGAEVDVLVIGSGVAGLAAANAAFEAGCRRILIAEAGGVVGGSSRLSGGIVMGAGTRYQAAAGIDDDADALFHDYMTLNQWDVDAGVVRTYADEIGPAVDWLGDLGVQFYPDLIFAGDERVPRCVCAIGAGQGIVDALHARSRERDIDVALGRRVDRLLIENGVVVGAAAGDDEIRAVSTVMCTGGFGADPDKLARYFPDAAATGDWAWYIGADGARGDGIDLGATVDARVVGFNRGLRLLHPNFVRTLEAYLPVWLVLVDRDGQRFVDETAPYGIMDGLVRAHGDVVYAIFDEAVVHPERDESATRYKQAIPGREGASSPNWNPVMLQEMVEHGRIASGSTIEDLAAALGLPPRNLRATIERFNSGATSGEDDFAKPAKYLQPIARPPFYGAELRPATICLTSCGLRIDRHARVINLDGRPVPGLFAAGEATGGVLGDRYVGSGNSLSNCATFGRIAGRQAAARAVATGATRQVNP